MTVAGDAQLISWELGTRVRTGDAHILHTGGTISSDTRSRVLTLSPSRRTRWLAARVPIIMQGDHDADLSLEAADGCLHYMYVDLLTKKS
jgi:hypothetical protein